MWLRVGPGLDDPSILFAERRNMPRPVELSGALLGPLAEGSSRFRIPEGPDGLCERGRIVGSRDDPDVLAEPLGGSVRGARDDRKSRGGRFEGDIGEGVIAGGKEHPVDRLVDGGEICTFAEETNVVAESQGVGLRSPRAGIVTARDPESEPVVLELRHRFERGRQSLAPPARARQEPDLLGPSVELATQPRAVPDGVGGAEALGVDGIREQQDPLARDALGLDEGVRDQPRGTLDALARVAEDTSFEIQEGTVAWGELAERAPDRVVVSAQIVRVAASAGPVEVLVAGSRKAVHDIETPASGRPVCCAGEEADAQGLPEGGGDHPFKSNPIVRAGRLEGGFRSASGAFAGEDRDLLALTRQLVDDLPRDVLDAAGARDEAFDHDGDAQGGCPLAERARVSVIRAGCEWARNDRHGAGRVIRENSEPHCEYCDGHARTTNPGCLDYSDLKRSGWRRKNQPACQIKAVRAWRSVAGSSGNSSGRSRGSCVMDRNAANCARISIRNLLGYIFIGGLDTVVDLFLNGMSAARRDPAGGTG